jgi:hypothetical protein
VKSQADGVEPTASNFRRAENSLLVDVCFEFPDDGDWTIWSASLRYGKTIIQDFRSDPIVVREPERDGMQTVTDFGNGGKNSWAEPATKGDPGGRCDTLSFEMPPDTKPQELELSIDSIAAAPREGELCSQASLDRLQAAVDARAEGILIGCQDNGEQGEGFEVLSTPLEVSQAQAEELALGPDVFLDAFGVRGPWTYDVPPDL